MKLLLNIKGNTPTYAQSIFVVYLSSYNQEFYVHPQLEDGRGGGTLISASCKYACAYCAFIALHLLKVIPQSIWP